MTADAYHPDLRRIARVLPRGPFTRPTLPLLRTLSRLPERRVPSGVEVLSTGTGARVRLHRPATVRHERSALLWIHGGGYVIGCAAQDDGLCRRLAARVGVPVFAVDYGLAPAHPYPFGLEDCYSALKLISASEGIDPERIAIGGASAGGGLTAALALLARERGEIAPLFQLLVYPMLDDRPCPPTTHHRLWSPASDRIGWDAYLRDADVTAAVPARREHLGGLPAAWLGVGTLDPLHAEGVDYARRLTAAGVPCALHVVPGAFHGFDIVASRAGVSKAFFTEQCRALNEAFASGIPR